MSTVTATACKGCGAALPERVRPGRERIWCSDRCRKDSYSTTCERCSARIPYNGYGRTVCSDCTAIEMQTLTWKTRQGEVVRAGRCGYTEAQLRDALLAVAVDGRVTVAMYNAYYKGREGTIPSAQAFLIRYGTWNAAVEAFGLSHGDSRRTYTRLSDGKLADDVARVMSALGKTPSVRDYTTYRAAHPEMGLASCAIIRRYLGGWPEALAMAGAA